MERVTFPDPKVREALKKHVAVKINVERTENRVVCERYRPLGGSPSFAIVLPDGTLRRQFGGFHEPTPFLDALTNAKAPEPGPALPTGPALKARIKKNIETFDKPAPGQGLTGVLEWFGLRRRQSRANWAKGQNAALYELTRIGKPAVPALLHAVEHGSARAAERCAVVLGRIRALEAKPRLASLLRHRRSRVRIAAAKGMAGYCDRAFLPALVGRLEDCHELLAVRNEAVRAIDRIVASYVGIADTALAKALVKAARHDDDAYFRWECLQALRSLESRIDLDELFPFMEDRRVAFVFPCKEDTVSDCAFLVFLHFSGHDLIRADGAALESYKPKVVAFLQSWYQREKEALVWDPELRHYRKRKRAG